jgi:hypothetical protein
VSVDIRAAKRRLAVMGVINVIAVLAAAASLVGYFRFNLTWALGAFVVAMLVGFGAQIWFIAALKRADKGA